MRSRAAAAARGMLTALWAPRSWRATLHALTGLVIMAVTVVLLGAWAAAIYSLASGATGAPVLTVIYAVAAVAGAVVAAWWLRMLSAIQRARFRAVLGVEIPEPPVPPGGWLERLAGGWRGAAAWRHLGYHLLALTLGSAAGVAVALCWSALLVVAVYPGDLPVNLAVRLVLAAALLLAAPWVARAVAGADTAAAGTLLGPSPSQELARRVASLARSRAEIVAATDAERRRIERDLHDGAQQHLVSLAMNLGMVRAALAQEPGSVPPATRQAIEQAHDEAIEALAGLRELVRGLHPAVLNDRGLDAALSGIVARAPLPVRLRVDLATRCAPSIEAIAYFTVSEALTNVAKHAQATRAEVTVERAGGRLRVVVTDDGRGGASLDGDGTGLRGLAQRTAAVDGTLSLASPAGGPTTLTLELPCE